MTIVCLEDEETSAPCVTGIRKWRAEIEYSTLQAHLLLKSESDFQNIINGNLENPLAGSYQALLRTI